MTLFRRDAVPALQNRVWATRADAVNAPMGRIELVACPACGHGWNACFDAGLARYEASYDNRQDASPAFDAYLDQRVEALSREVDAGQTVVEVGCGQGGFLRRLVRRTGARGIGFDPAYRERAGGDEISLHARPYGPSEAAIPADLVICRHVIEHVREPSGLVRSVRSALRERPAARVVFECPDLNWITEHQVVWDVFYEHVQYFTPRSLRVLFERCGFSVSEHRSVFAGQYQWLVARPSEGRPVLRDDPPDLGPLRALGEAHRGFVAHMQALLTHLRADGPVVLWGAGAKGVTLANLIDPDGECIDGLVDVNPAKQGRFVPGTGHLVLAPSELPTRGVAHALVLNPAYADEIAATVVRDDLGVRLHPAPTPRSLSCSPCSPSAFRPGTVPRTSSAA